MTPERMYSIILGPHVSEKSTLLSEEHKQYTFKVAANATKPQIREAIETLFEVDVEELQVLKVKGKTKRTARQKLRKRSDWKKAYVRLSAGQEIDFADAG
ncbi:MAG: 50S ribosomal protein L23 [Pseudohongiellaceae bacterium]